MGLQHIDEIKALVESGDVNLEEYREAYRKSQQRETLLTDDDLIKLIAVDEEKGPLDDENKVLAMLYAEDEKAA